MLELGYIGLSVLMSLVLVGCYNQLLLKTGIDNSIRLKKVALPIIGLFAWFTYVTVLGATDFIKVYELPPRFPLLFVIPTFVFSGILLYRKRNSNLLHSVPKQWTVYYQSFRIVIEILFAKTVLVEYLHPEVTYLGYNHDVWFGVSAIVLGLGVYQFKIIPENWCYIGIT